VPRRPCSRPSRMPRVGLLRTWPRLTFTIEVTRRCLAPRYPRVTACLQKKKPIAYRLSPDHTRSRFGPHGPRPELRRDGAHGVAKRSSRGRLFVVLDGLGAWARAESLILRELGVAARPTARSGFCVVFSCLGVTGKSGRHDVLCALGAARPRPGPVGAAVCSAAPRPSCAPGGPTRLPTRLQDCHGRAISGALGSGGGGGM
jgi:hypothetical protein